MFLYKKCARNMKIESSEAFKANAFYLKESSVFGSFPTLSVAVM